MNNNIIGGFGLVLAITLLAGSAMAAGKGWDKTFPKSDKVDHQKVKFKNRYGITLAGDLYLPKERGDRRLAGLVVSGALGAVKEQVSGLYAQAMAERGFATLTFDPSYTGESGGEPRNLASPEIYTEDYSAAVDYLGTRPFADRERIGVIAICGSASIGLNATAGDKRIKAVAVVSMYDMSRVMRKGMNDSITREQLAQMLENLGRQRWADFEKGAPAYGPRVLPETLAPDSDSVTREIFDYYRTKRGYHKNSVNSTGGWTATTPLSFINMPMLTYIAEISPRPILMVVGEKAHSRYFSEDLYKLAAEPKELLIVPGARHMDLYDDVKLIPFDRITAFFAEHLK